MELAGLPWTLVLGRHGDLVRCEMVCPVCAILNAERPEVSDDYALRSWWWRAAYWLNWPLGEARPVANAADDSTDPLRPRLLELLGVSQ